MDWADDLDADSSDSEDETSNEQLMLKKKKTTATRKKHVVYTGGGRKSAGGKWEGGVNYNQSSSQGMPGSGGGATNQGSYPGPSSSGGMQPGMIPNSSSSPPGGMGSTRSSQYQKRSSRVSSSHEEMSSPHKHQRLLLLRHATKCPYEDGKCPVTEMCADTKILWKHISDCKDQQCKVQHCLSSRYLLSHHRRCKDSRCPACEPVRDVIRKSQAAAAHYEAQLINMDLRDMPSSGGSGSSPYGQGAMVPSMSSSYEGGKPSAEQPPNKRARTSAGGSSGGMRTPQIPPSGPMGAPSMMAASAGSSAKSSSILWTDRTSSGASSSATPAKTEDVSSSSLINSFTVEHIEKHIASLNHTAQLPPAELKTKCLDILKTLMQHEHGWLFNCPVDPVELGLPDYLDIIKKPMDLGTIQKKLERGDNGQYHSLEDFCADVHLTFDNAILYNEEGSVVHTMAKELKDVFVVEHKKALAELKKEEERLLKDEILPLLYEDENESGALYFFEAVGEGSSIGSTTLHEWKVLKRSDTGKTYYYNVDLVKLVGVDADSLETVRGSIFAVKTADLRLGFGISPILRLNRLLRLQNDLEESKRSIKGSVTIKNTQVSDKARDSVLDYTTALLQKSSFDSHLDAMVLPDDIQACLPLNFFYGNSGGINLSTTTSPLNGVVACVEVSSGISSATSKDGGGNLITYHKIHAMHLGAPFTVGSMATAHATGAAAGSTPGVNVAAPFAMASSSMAAAGSASGGSASGSTQVGSTSTAGGATPGGLDGAGSPPGGQGQGFSLFEKSKKFLRSPKIRNCTDDPWFAVRVFSKHVEETFNTLTELVAKLNIGADITGAANIGAEAEARRTAVIERVSREVMTAAQRATTHGIPPKHDHSITHKPPHYYCLCTRDVTTLPHTVGVWSKLELHEDIGTDVYIVSSSHPAAAEPLFGRAVYDESSIMQVVLNLAFGNQLRGLIGDRAIQRSE